MNVVLLGMRLYLQGRTLIDRITTNVCEDLRNAILAKTALNDIEDFVTWRETVAVMDEKRLAERKKFLKLIAATRPSNNLNRQNSASKAATSSTNTRLPKLTEDEKNLLAKHDGCYKCRCFYAGHRALQCPNNFPDAKLYRPLSENDALVAGKKAKQVAPRAIAAITESSEIAPNAVVAVHAYTPGSPPAMTLGILGFGLDSKDELCILPSLFVPHLIWDAILHNSDGPTWPCPIKMLIDGGAPTVLIREDIVSAFELRRRKLHESEPLGNAWGTENKEAMEWIKLRVLTPCNTWSSITVRALVVPSLCVPVLLGHSFLKPNRLSEDHENDCLIYNPTGTDLLHLPKPAPPPPKLTPKERRQLKAQHERKLEQDRVRFRKEFGAKLLSEISSYLEGN